MVISLFFQEYILIFNTYNVGPPFDSVQLRYKWLNAMVYDTYNSIHVFLNQIITRAPHIVQSSVDGQIPFHTHPSW